MAKTHRRPDARRAPRRARLLTACGVIAVALLAAAGIRAAVGGGEDGHPAAAAAGSPSASSPGNTATPNAPAATPPGSQPVVPTYSGSGNKVLKIKKPGAKRVPVLVVATHQGSGRFAVLALDSALQESDILVNVAGRYRGTTLLDARGTQTRQLKVQARGPWTVTIMPVSSARTVDARAKSTGDDVFRYRGTAGVATFDYRGGSSFVVTYFRGASTAVLVNRVGRFHGQVPIQKGPALVSVQANGGWTLRVAR